MSHVLLAQGNVCYQLLSAESSALGRVPCTCGIMSRQSNNQKRFSGKANHALSLMVSLEKMKENDFLCDFTIIVRGCPFLVHRAVLAACSGYFKGLFSSNMKEVKEGLVDMKGVDPVAIRRCIEFMYTGEILLADDEVQSVLLASNLLQLEDLTDRCLRFLGSNLSTDNCLFTINMSRLYGRNDITEAAILFTRENFESVVSTDMFPFITAPDLTYFVRTSKCNFRTLWTAITAWLRYHGNNATESFKQVVSLVNPENFPFDFLFSTALEELAEENCNEGAELVLSNIFSNLPALEMNLNLDNCFTLHQLNQSRRSASVVKLADNVIVSFMAANLSQIIQKAEFIRFKKEDVLKLFRLSQRVSRHCETAIWDAINNWVGYTKDRKKHFPELFLALQLENVYCDFIKRHLIVSEMVWESRVCKWRIIKSLRNRIASSDSSTSHKVPCLATFSHENSEFHALEVQCMKWFTLTCLPSEDVRRIASVDGKIFALGERLLSFENDGTWKEAAMLQRQPCPWCQLTSFRGALHVVEGRYMARYDIRKNEWTEDLPGCALVMGFFVASDDKSLYAMGGHNATMYDPTTKDWLPIAPMRVQRFDAAAAVANAVVYVMGGTLFGKIYKSMEYYDPRSQCWADIVGMKDPRSHFSACVVGNSIYAIGGSKRAEERVNHMDSVEAFDIVSRQWSVVSNITTNGSSRVLACFHKFDVTDIIDQLTASLGVGK